MSTEILGLDQSIAYAQHLTTQAAAHGPDGNEGYLQRLQAARVVGSGLTTAANMQAAFAAAAAAATAHATELIHQKNVQEAYDMTPDAGDKEYLTSNSGGTEPAAAAALDGLAVERSLRDRLARGAYIAQTSRPDWQRDMAREWDAGNVDAEHRDAAYASADQTLALLERASDPGHERIAVMRDNGIRQCPSWCLGENDEHEYEAHLGRRIGFSSEDGDSVIVRPHVSWWPDADPTPDIEVSISGPSTRDGTVVLTGRDLDHLQDARHEALAVTAATALKPAYPGADAEAADADHPATNPTTAAAALDMQARAGGYSPSEDTDADGSGAYLDWSTRPDVGVRSLEAGDGDGTVELTLTTDRLQDLHDGLGRAIGALDDGVDDPGQLLCSEDNTYIDWSVVEDGVRSIEFGDGFAAVQLELTEDQVRELHERLALQLYLDQQEAAR